VKRKGQTSALLIFLKTPHVTELFCAIPKMGTEVRVDTSREESSRCPRRLSCRTGIRDRCSCVHITIVSGFFVLFAHQKPTPAVLQNCCRRSLSRSVLCHLFCSSCRLSSVVLHIYTRSAAQLSIAVASSRRVSAYYYNRKVRKKVLPRLRSSPTHFYVAYAILAWRYASLSSLFSLP
jgi:hypothetical protein